MPANVARANFYKLIKEAGENMRQFTVIPRGKPSITVMSTEEFEGWQETMEIMSDKRLVARLKQAKKDLKAGKGIPWEKVRDTLK